MRTTTAVPFSRRLRAFLLSAIVAVSTMTLSADEKDAARAEWMTGYIKLENGDKAVANNNLVVASGLYKEALDVFAKVQSKYPNWNPTLLKYRIAYCQQQIEKLEAKYKSDTSELSKEDLIALNARQAEQLQLMSGNQEELKNRVATLSDAMGKLQAAAQKAAALEEAVTTLGAEKKILQDEAARSGLRLKEALAQVATLSDGAELQTKLTRAEEALRNAQDVNTKLQADAAQHANTLQLSQARTAELTKQAELARTQIEQLQTDASASKEILDAQRETLENQRIQLAAMEAKQALADKTANEQGLLATTLRQEKAAMATELADLRQFKDRILAEREAEKQSLSVNADTTRKEIQTLKGDVAALNTQLSEAKAQSQQLATELAAKQNQLENDRVKAITSEEARMNLFAELERTKTKLSQTEAQNLKLTTEVNQLTTQQRGSLDSSNALAQEAKDTSAKLITIRQELADQGQKLLAQTALTTRQESIIAEMTRLITLKEKEKNDQAAQLAEAKQALATAQQQAADQLAKLNDASAAKAALELDLANKSRGGKESSDELEQLQTQRQALQKRLAELHADAESQKQNTQLLLAKAQQDASAKELELKAALTTQQEQAKSHLSKLENDLADQQTLIEQQRQALANQLASQKQLADAQRENQDKQLAAISRLDQEKQLLEKQLADEQRLAAEQRKALEEQLATAQKAIQPLANLDASASAVARELDATRASLNLAKADLAASEQKQLGQSAMAEQHKKTIAELQNRIRTLEIKTQNKENDENTLALAVLAKEEQGTLLAKRVAELEEKLQTTSLSATEQADAKQRLEQNIAAAQAKLADAEKTAQAAMAERDALDKKLQAEIALRIQQEGAVAGLLQQKRNQESELAEASRKKSDATTLEQQLRDVTTDKQLRERELKELRQAREEQNLQLSMSKQQLAKLEDELRTLKIKAAFADQPAATAQPATAAPSGGLNTLQEEVKALHQRLQDKDKQLLDQDKQLMAKERDLIAKGQLIQAMAGSEQEKVAWMKQLEEMTKRAQQEENQRLELEKALKEKEQQRAKDLADMETKLIQVTAELTRLEQERVKSEADIVRKEADHATQERAGKVATNQALRQGLEAERAGNAQAASEFYRQVLEKEPTNSMATQRLGILAATAGNDAETITYLQQSFKQNPDDTDTLLALGTAMVRQSKPDLAISMLSRAVALDEKNASAARAYGMALLSAGWRDAAEAQLKRAAALQPKDGDAAYNLAVLMATSQPARIEEARQWYQKALKAGAQPDPGMDALLKK